MSVMQGLATGGGTSARGTVRACRSIVATPMASSQVIEPKMDDLLKPDDVIYIQRKPVLSRDRT